ncbi:creatininase family protein [Planctomycetota bacterium]
MADEVRYHMLRPNQIVARRKECSVAYIPIGTIEWHGVHNAVGADSLQAEGLSVRAARKGGGLVFPPLYYGESRSEALMEVNASREAIAGQMELPPENFAVENFPFTASEQTTSYNVLLRHILAEVETLGFEVGVLVAGHYPLIDHCRAAVLQHNQKRTARSMLAWAVLDCNIVQGVYEHPGDHAGGWETSHMMHLHPETVDLSLLPPKGEKLIGAGGTMEPQDSTAEFGEETLEAAAELIVNEVKDRLENPDRYRRHGHCLKEGLWR